MNTIRNRGTVLSVLTSICASLVASPPPEVPQFSENVEFEWSGKKEPKEGWIFPIIAFLKGKALWKTDGKPFSGTLSTQVFWGDRRTLEPRGAVRYLIVTDFVDGLRNGVERQFSKDKDLLRETHFAHGLRNGMETIYSRRIRECHVNDLEVDYGAEYFSVEYVNDRMHGRSNGFDANDRIAWDVNFVADMAHPYETDPRYALTSEIETRDGLCFLKGRDMPFTGCAVLFHPNGKFYIHSEYKNGLFDGTRISCFGNGQLESIETWKGGKRHGYEIHWMTPQQPSSQSLWIDGKQVTWFGYDGSGKVYDHKQFD